MILVADSGSTNTDWVIIEKDKIISSFITNGFNPYFTESKEIYKELKIKVPENLQINDISNIYFYGSGCSSSELNSIIHNGLNHFFPDSDIEIYHDLLAAARALFMHDSGIVIILGTGANTCLYDGKNIVQNIPSLGYILGDEGGGDYLGKLFITEFLYGNLPKKIHTEFLKRYELTNDQIMNKIYKESNPNRFLASFCEFISKHKEDSFLNTLVKKSFTDLFLNHITKYENYTNFKIRVTGSVGFHFQNQLKEVAKEFNTHIDLI
ncbi:MAG: ATPase, partial [Bacteroidales bacterium]|nr:ATPase [Bacteroidales bacterium]